MTHPGTTPETLERLFGVIRKRRVVILMHNNPDPDALAGAFAMRYLLAKRLGVSSRIYYGGIIGRAENVAMAQQLHIPLHHVRTLAPDSSEPIVLIDTQPTAGNNILPRKAVPTAVIDHHRPIRKATHLSPFVDVRTEYGSASTIVAEYIATANLTPPRDVATALFYGIKTDTYDLGREATVYDVDIYRELMTHVRRVVLSHIERPLRTRAYYQQIHKALENAVICEDVIFTHLEELPYPDIVAEVADWLFPMRGARAVLVVGGVKPRHLLMSLRIRSHRRDAALMIRSVVGRHGSAGGHGMIAGGEIPLCDDSRETYEKTVAHVLERYLSLFIKAKRGTPHRVVPLCENFTLNSKA